MAGEDLVELVLVEVARGEAVVGALAGAGEDFVGDGVDVVVVGVLADDGDEVLLDGVGLGGLGVGHCSCSLLCVGEAFLPCVF